MTYSIVARDPGSGGFGVAVQSHFFQVGPVVPWARAGVGAVATQADAEIRYGPLGLDLMAAGYPAGRALAAALAADPKPETRQVALVDRDSQVAVHTGAKCIREAGHHVGAGYSVQANMMQKATVWQAMAEAFEGTAGSLAERMMAALEAAEVEGGDIRGRQSAAMLVVDGELHPGRWEGRLIDLRVEDHPEPLVELRRLLEVKRTYESVAAAQTALHGGDPQGATLTAKALERAEDNTELRSWLALDMAAQGDLETAVTILRDVIRQDERWLELLRRLPSADLLKPELLAQLEDRLKAPSTRSR
ncbi:MAG: DUF1028 domain-containing protein [Chloroflexi bacterium]|nr:MAG: DUF1028 domain-containing protein [Chloroflexota bacterium]